MLVPYTSPAAGFPGDCQAQQRADEEEGGEGGGGGGTGRREEELAELELRKLHVAVHALWAAGAR